MVVDTSMIFRSFDIQDNFPVRAQQSVFVKFRQVTQAEITNITTQRKL